MAQRSRAEQPIGTGDGARLALDVAPVAAARAPTGTFASGWST